MIKIQSFGNTGNETENYIPGTKMLYSSSNINLKIEVITW